MSKALDEYLGVEPQKSVGQDANKDEAVMKFAKDCIPMIRKMDSDLASMRSKVPNAGETKSTAKLYRILKDALDAVIDAETELVHLSR